MSEVKMKDLYKEENEKAAEKQKIVEAKTEKISDTDKYKKYRIFFRIFIALTILSIIDMMTREFMSAQGVTTGYISLLLGAIFSVFGDSFAALMMVVFDTIFSLALLWIVLIFVMRSKMKKFKNN